MSEAAVPSATVPAEALLLDRRAVVRVTDLSGPTIDRLTAAGTFPAPRVVPGCRSRRGRGADIGGGGGAERTLRRGWRHCRRPAVTPCLNRETPPAGRAGGSFRDGLVYVQHRV